MPSQDVDRLARKLFEWAELARQFPPAWDGAGISQPIRGLDERETIGRMLPGRGLYLEHDLKSVGILKPIPGVFERSKVLRGVDRLQKLRRDARRILWDEQASITTYDGIINARGNGGAEDRMVLKSSLTTVANVWSSLWQVGGMPVGGSFSSALTNGTNPNNATTGALSFGLSTPSSPSLKYLLTFGFTSSSAINMLLLMDMLFQVGAVSAASAASQAITPSALTRYTTGAGCNITGEVTTAIGTTASNLQVTYKNQAGTGGQLTASEAMTPSMITSRLVITSTAPLIPLASGDYGVQTITAAKLSAAMTAGVFSLYIYYPLMFLPGITSNIYIERDSTIQIDGIQNLPIGSDSAIGCLNAAVQTNGVTSGIVVGTMRTVFG
jgi:hypothetical protein